MKIKEITVGIGPTIVVGKNYHKTTVSIVADVQGSEDLKPLLERLEKSYWEALAVELRIAKTIDAVDTPKDLRLLVKKRCANAQVEER